VPELFINSCDDEVKPDPPLVYPYLTGYPGSGKTHIAIKYGAEVVADGRPVAVIQPSKLLIDTTVRDLHKLSPQTPISVIHSDTHPNTTVSAAVKWFQNPTGMLFITHECHDRIPFIQSKKRVITIVDEIPKLLRFLDRKMSRTHNLITDYVEAVSVGDGQYSILRPKDMDTIDDMVRVKNDQFYDEMKPLTSALVSGNWDVYVETEQFQKLIQGDKEYFRLSTFAVRKPSSFSGYRETLFLGALFEETMLYHRWSKEGVQFHSRDDLYRKLRRPPNGGLIDIYPLVEGPWSKHMRKSDADLEEAFRDAAMVIMDGDQHVWLSNVDRPEMFEDRQSRLPGSPYGHNHYQHYNNAVITSALNPKPDQCRFLSSPLMGLTDEQIRTEFMYLPTFQAVMRTSARNPENTARKKFLVQDLGTAQAIGRWLPGSRVHEPVLPVRAWVGRPRKWNNDAERKRAQRRRAGKIGRQKNAERMREKRRRRKYEQK
jgi:hypothetical protein